MRKFMFYMFLYATVYFADASLKWSSSYTLKAVLTVPAANIREPYQVWLDGDTGKSRVDFYDGMDKLYRQWDDVARKYQFFKIHPETTDTFENRDVCIEVSADETETKMYTLNTYLPVKNFKFSHKENLNNVQAQKWTYEYSVTFENKVRAKVTYAVWVTFRDGSIPVPVRYVYEMKADDMILDYFRHDYSLFDTKKPEPSDIQKPLGINCGALKKSIHEPIDPLAEFIEPYLERSRISEAFDGFKQKHNKTYTEDEHFKRMNIFKNNLRFINSLNRKQKSYTVAVNHFADRAIDELSIFMGTEVTHEKYKHYDSDDDEESNDINSNELEGSNTNFDWRDFGAITPVKDQTTLCGACYAFTTAAAIESAAFIARGCKYLDEVSEQVIIDCSWSQNSGGNLGCRGGTYEYSLEWVKKNGIPFKADYGPYLAMEGRCHMKNMTKLVRIQTYEAITKQKRAIKEALRKFGPLLVSVDSSPQSFYFYEKGVYDDRRCSNNPDFRSHGVTLVGYGMENGQEYWIVKNSFGESWGEKGYMRIAVKFNICGLKNYVYRVGFTKNKVDYCKKVKFECRNK